MVFEGKFKEILLQGVFKEETEEMTKMIVFYRYVSFMITSFFYLLHDTTHLTEKKVFIVLSMGISSVIINYLYIRNENSITKIKVLILIETLGNSFILIPSGGLNSPYVWYCLNTILIASTKLKYTYCWINLGVYLFNFIGIPYFLDNGLKTRDFTNQESNLILSFILISGVIQLLAKYGKNLHGERTKLLETNNRLVGAHQKNKEALNHIMELYRAVHLFTNEKSSSNLVKLIMEHSKKITGSQHIIFLQQKGSVEEILMDSTNLSDEFLVSMKEKFSMIWQEITHSDHPIEKKVQDKRLIFIGIKCTYKVFGVLGMVITDNRIEDMEKDMLEQWEEQLKFLADLSSITLEKFQLEQVAEGLVINEEQNRIANEIHDGILQKLFVVSCGILEISRNASRSNSDAKIISTELNSLRNSINCIMKELRSTIYGMSWSKEGNNSFITDIEGYIGEIRRFNSVDISFHYKGKDELMSLAEKKSLYRIICEGVGNALRHGKAEVIKVELVVDPLVTTLEIVDKGIGFDFKDLDIVENRGLGLRNIYHLTTALGGQVKFHSRLGFGTMISITIPKNLQVLYKEEAV